MSISPHELVLYVGGPGTTPQEAVDIGRNLGPLGVLLNEAPPEIVDVVSRAVVDELAARWDGAGIALRAAIAIVAARPR